MLLLPTCKIEMSTSLYTSHHCTIHKEKSCFSCFLFSPEPMIPLYSNDLLSIFINFSRQGTRSDDEWISKKYLQIYSMGFPLQYCCKTIHQRNFCVFVKSLTLLFFWEFCNVILCVLLFVNVNQDEKGRRSCSNTTTCWSFCDCDIPWHTHVFAIRSWWKQLDPL